jgi:hypothetical protein
MLRNGKADVGCIATPLVIGWFLVACCVHSLTLKMVTSINTYYTNSHHIQSAPSCEDFVTPCSHLSPVRGSVWLSYLRIARAFRDSVCTCICSKFRLRHVMTREVTAPHPKD